MDILEFEEINPEESRMKLKLGSEEIKAEFENALTELMSDSEIPGFRPGKAPRNIVERHIGPNEIWRMARDRASRDAFEKVLKEKESTYTGAPDYQHTDYMGEGDYEVEIIYHSEPMKHDDKKGPDEHIPEQLRRNPNEDHQRLMKSGPTSDHGVQKMKKQKGNIVKPNVQKRKIPGQ